MIWLLAGLLLGVFLGRLYGWMKYHYPEFQEELALRVVKLRTERMKYEAQQERYRSQLDEEIERRLR